MAVPLRCEDVMTRNPRCCAPDDTLLDEVKLMKELDVGFVPVCGAGDRAGDGVLVGVLTDRDVALALADDQRPGHHRIREVMSKDPVTCRPDDDALECARRMESFQIRRIPVVDRAQKLVGVVALADIAHKAARRPEISRAVPAVMDAVSRPGHSG
jgi:CBS domain-containing protein